MYATNPDIPRVIKAAEMLALVAGFALLRGHTEVTFSLRPGSNFFELCDALCPEPAKPT